MRKNTVTNQWAKAVIGLVTLLLVTVCGCSLDPSMRHYVQGNLYVSFDISPDGNKIVFAGAGNGGKDLYLFDLRTHAITPLTNTLDYEANPSFSPDGRSIVYCSAKNLDQPHYLFLRSLDGSRLKQLTSDTPTADEYPSFSPNGKTIVFARARTFYADSRGEDTWDNFDVYSVNVDGSSLKRITRIDYDCELHPRFFPDGENILFEGAVCDPNAAGGCQPHIHLYKVNASGFGLPTEFLTYGQETSSGYVFAGGREMVFVADHLIPFSYEIYRTSLPKFAPISLNVTHFSEQNSNLVVTPDGKSVLFLSLYDANLCEVGIDGSNPHQIANGSLFTDPLHWKG